MNAARELSQFLRSRRDKLAPSAVGLVPAGVRRRVPGLRRDEVAVLAGVSVEWYTRLEQGRAKGASEEVLFGVARALKLNEIEQTHLFDLVRALGPAHRSSPARTPTVRGGLLTLLDTITGAAAIMLNEHGDVLGANTLARALYRDLFRSEKHGTTLNLARFILLDPAGKALHRDWDEVAGSVTALLRAAAGRNPYSKGLTDLVGELSTRSDFFRIRWAAHDVEPLTTGRKRFRHPDVGGLDLGYEYLTVSDSQGISILTYFAEPGTPAHDGLQLLAAVAASGVLHGQTGS
ncbi:MULTISPECIES: helix-turn-helix domain-containing protein [Streptomyces]|uniref:Helix-turn-helix transcriptional regulator n=1 Tax=Streptomyces edwardsiae TaxID=3075527 RepID=A0ABU2QMJ6_9ACTN|nr:MULTISPECIES: helix-turn-helix transcriptional regulator [unclassified Streptomyces]MDT0405277.1 helix-turn-helix transcriptional regulator [Streptomyces sp. DSM 41635]